MNRYTAIGILSLLVIIIALPIYAAGEPARMDLALTALREKRIELGTVTYLENCAYCHGLTGEGIGAMPALNQSDLAQADHQALFKVISRAAHGTTMAAWHVEEGGILNDHQINNLVLLLRFGNWSQVGIVGEEQGFEVMTIANMETDKSYMEMEGEEDPHQCAACHEEPIIHADKFGLNCARCHSAQAWVPAQLTKHTFPLAHGSDEQVACQTCHTINYVEYDCYQCHDHEPESDQIVHLDEGIVETASCAQCHPTGAEGEAADLGYGRSGQQAQQQLIIPVVRR